MLTRIDNQRGSAIWVTLGVAIVCAVAAYGALFTAQSVARRTQFHQERTRARYAAEAGYVWAMDQLWSFPGGRWLPFGGVVTAPTTPLVGGIAVNVTMPACAAFPAPCGSRLVTVTVSN